MSACVSASGWRDKFLYPRYLLNQLMEFHLIGLDISFGQAHFQGHRRIYITNTFTHDITHLPEYIIGARLKAD